MILWFKRRDLEIRDAAERATDSGQKDLFRARLDQIIDMSHPLAKLARTINWRFLEERFGAVYSDGSGHAPLPTRLRTNAPHSP